MSFLYDFPSSVENKKGILKNVGNQLVNSFGYTWLPLYVHFSKCHLLCSTKERR